MTEPRNTMTIPDYGSVTISHDELYRPVSPGAFALSGMLS